MTLSNRSHAVVEVTHASGDKRCDWPTPPWATRALFEHVILPRLSPQAAAMLASRAAWEPACNRGHMARPLAEYLGRIVATDLYDYGWEGQQARLDFLPVMGLETLPPGVRRFRDRLYTQDRPLDWIFTNPPFEAWDEFAARCIALRPMTGFALFGRLGALAGLGRYERIYSTHRPTAVAVFAERVNLVPGGLDPDAELPHLYAWYVWLTGEVRPTELVHIPPCRARLERAADYAGARPVKPAGDGGAA